MDKLSRVGIWGVGVAVSTWSLITGLEIIISDIRRPRDHLILNMGIPIPLKDSLYRDTGPRYTHVVTHVLTQTTEKTGRHKAVVIFKYRLDRNGFLLIVNINISINVVNILKQARIFACAESARMHVFELRKVDKPERPLVYPRSLQDIK